MKTQTQWRTRTETELRFDDAYQFKRIRKRVHAMMHDEKRTRNSILATIYKYLMRDFRDSKQAIYLGYQPIGPVVFMTISRDGTEYRKMVLCEGGEYLSEDECNDVAESIWPPTRDQILQRAAVIRAENPVRNATGVKHWTGFDGPGIPEVSTGQHGIKWTAE